MSDNITTFGVKVTEETKAQLQKALGESGLQGKDFMETLLNTYKMNETKKAIPTVTADLEELQTLTRRINDIYLNMSCRIECITSDQKRTFEDEQQALQEKLQQYETKIQELKENTKELKEKYQTKLNDINGEFTELTTVNQVNQQRIKELEGSIEDLKALNMEYKGKNGTLQGIIEEYKEYKVDIENYKRALESKQIQLDEAQKKSGKHYGYWQNCLKNIEDMKEQHLKELLQQSKESNVECKLKVVELQEKHQQYLNSINIKHNQEIAEYQQNYKKVLEEMEQLRKQLQLHQHQQQQESNKEDTK